MEGVRHINHFRERGDINHAEGAGGGADLALSNSAPNRFHWLPVVRFKATLNSIDLKTRRGPGVRLSLH